MVVDGYEIQIKFKLTEKIWYITFIVPSNLDKGIFDQIKANGFGYVEDNIPIF